MKSTISGCALAALVALGSGAALAQGASGIGAAASAHTPGNSIDRNPGSTGGVDTRVSGSASASMAMSGTTVQSSTTVSGSSATTIQYHWNVPASAEADPDFKRWQRLR